MKPLSEIDLCMIRVAETELKEYPKYEGCIRQKKFTDWLQNKTFPFKFSIDDAGYFREDQKKYNRLEAELICAEIDYDVDYKADYFHITLESEEQIEVYMKLHMEWWEWWSKGNTSPHEFSQMFIGNGLMHKMIEEGE